MKTSNKSSIVTGIVLLALAAFFSICLLLQPLDFGVGGPGHNNFFFLLGEILTTVYGFSSILIPVFLFIAGISCFASTWTARKTLRLLTAIIPFFTLVFTEKICRSILDVSSSFAAVKISVTLVTGIMLVVIEYLGIGIIADKINHGSIKDVFKPKPIRNKTSLKDKIKLPKRQKKSDHDMMIEDWEENVVTEDEITVEEEIKDNSEDENTNPSSMITQEEFAALTTPAFDNNLGTDPSNDQTPEDELEWSNLPPKPEKLPPEYDEDFIDENDPDLEFPPKEEFVEEEIVEEDSPFFDMQEDVVSDEELSERDDVSEKNVESDEEDVFSDSEISFDPSFDVAFADSGQEEPVKTSKYSDSVRENPAFSHGIVLHESNLAEESETEDEPEQKESFAPKFPSRIQLNDEYDPEEPAINSVTPVEVSENQFTEDDIAQEDIFEDNIPENDIANENIPEENIPEDNIPEDDFSSPIFPAAGSTVFSEMEEDIRRKISQPATEVTFSGIKPIQKQVGPSLEPPAAGVNNLTADELSDFFNAQQEENTPKTKEIAANPPRVGNRATKKGPYVIPSDLLTAYKDDQYWIIDDATKQASLNLKQTLAEFNIEAEIIGIKKVL